MQQIASVLYWDRKDDDNVHVQVWVVHCSPSSLVHQQEGTIPVCFQKTPWCRICRCSTPLLDNNVLYRWVISMPRAQRWWYRCRHPRHQRRFHRHCRWYPYHCGTTTTLSGCEARATLVFVVAACLHDIILASMYTYLHRVLTDVSVVAGGFFCADTYPADLTSSTTLSSSVPHRWSRVISHCNDCRCRVRWLLFRLGAL